MLDLSTIKQINFPENQYFKTEYNKNQIVIHHTVSGPGTRGDIQTWLNTKKRIGTCIIIERDGTYNQCFSSKYWAGHLGCGNIDLDHHSIAVELDNWGQLTPVHDRYYTVYGNNVKCPVQNYHYGFRGQYYFEKYTEEQINALKDLLIYWGNRYKIPLDYHNDMWDISNNALTGVSGIWAHVSFRKYGKWDCHPQPELIDMLKLLNS
jgi:N-acetyl-anhydromuramyl-L-alanine amidase AmpD